ncbi:hypothetical protein [Micromonospora endophytica]|uniref:Uncharacterized protein n=1 Tax=Micromonospora endophytica TaxID=515350 RepID=A0A2W2DV65_9ACTN|nr:hypothetical protein [Micromonospora endophytica]PZG01067.1 hypothetical protein C1I93_00845 [Micromonospora endophytica]RIW47892.1 hypothetical protein D3H59_08405 [Micromonospora endophytica]BCJ62257.1 hypothetical protein Jiend_56790 [Micromonospora endophytica]
MRLAAYGLALIAGLAVTGAPNPAPQVTLDRAEAAPGEQVQVRLTGWPTGTVVIELCGSGGPARCARDTSAQIHVPGGGAGGAPLTVSVPPGGCPCQLRVSTLDTRFSVDVPLLVSGAAPPDSGTVRQAATGPPVVVGASVERDRGWPARFGAPARRTVVLRLRNEQAAPAAVALSFRVGRAPSPTGFVAPPAVPDLAPGEERVIRIPVTLPALALGSYEIHGEIVTAGTAHLVVVTTDHHPWGLAGLLALAALTLLPTRRPRRSIGRR